jgi:glutamate-ammonia-ligase adenylyltransferase
LTSAAAGVSEPLDDLLSPEQRALLAGEGAGALESLRHAMRCSGFVRDAVLQDPTLLRDVLPLALGDGAAIGRRWCFPEGTALEPGGDEAAAMAWLRRWRRRQMVCIAWRDLAGLAPLEETLRQLSEFADAAIDFATRQAWATLVARYGAPRYPDGRDMPMVVVGMGKLGGGELNFSSDIDLVFLFPAAGETAHAQPLSHDEFFMRLGQGIVRLLSAVTADGIVFRVDMRLRPFGDSGPLACSFAAFEDYLAQHGRDWERYAWIKARPVTGIEAWQELFAEGVRPFVYRRYLDFGIFESLREMKQLIEKQVARRDLADHLKLGPGGIREIEFMVQAFQLIRGGQDRRLQSPGLLSVLPQLSGGRLLPAATVTELDAAYRFLRTLENRLQMLRDAQTHQLPADDAERARLAAAMGVADWSALLATLDAHRGRVQRHFNGLVFQPAASPEGPAPRELPAPQGVAFALWDEAGGAAGLAQALEAAGLRDAVESARLLMDFREGAQLRRLDATGRRRVQRLLPELVGELRTEDEHLPMLRRFVRVIEAIGARSSYFALLNENPAARRRFVATCRAGDFLVAQIAAHPLLLDELLDERVFAQPPSRNELAADLAARLAGLPPDEPERLVEALARFKRAAVFRIAIADLVGGLPVMQVSDRLTDVAELIVGEALEQAWRQMAAQFGVPMCGVGVERREVRACAVGYGKLGGMELGYGSDLDLIFLHDSTGEAQATESERPLDNQVFFLRFAQRILHLLTVHSAAGRLYEVDVRLRPSGKGGFLVTNIGAFALYQEREAWTWEHQALLHARAVAGAESLRAAFEAVRLDTLTRHVKLPTLREEVRSMRERMRRELSKAGPGEFDLKQDPGGIADIEFLAQYWALLWAPRHPAVAIFSDTIRQLETLASGALVPQQDVDVLTSAYRAFRTRGHRRSLQEAPSVVPASEFVAERAAVRAIWDACFAL